MNPTDIAGNAEECRRRRTTITTQNWTAFPETWARSLVHCDMDCFSDNDYTEVDGLQRDMAPDIGSVDVKTITIEKNDNAEGIVEFESAAVDGKFLFHFF